MILHLTLKKKWFDMIASGEKKEEYREIKPHWVKRFGYQKRAGMNFYAKPYIRVIAKNGYQTDAPSIIWEHQGIRIGKPNPAWCEPGDVDKEVFILKIGDIIKKPI